LAHPKERATPTPAHFPPAVEHPKVTIVNAPQSAVGPAPTSEPSLNAFWDRFQMKMDAMTAEMTELPPVETCLDPVVYLEPCAPKRGDTPMMRNWKMITMISLMSAAAIPLAPMPIVAGEKETGELKKSIDKLIERIDALERKPLDDKAIAKALRNELDKLEKGMLAEIQTDIAGVQSEQRKLKKQFEDQKFLIELLTGRIDSLEKKVALGGTATPSVDKAFMDELRTMIRGINDTLAKSGPIQERRSMSAPTGNGDLGQGRVLLANYYPEQLLFVVNGVGYRLPARSTKLVDVPSGTVSYEVFSERYGVLERRTTNLASGNTFNLSAQ
jgi:hypothetical protein